MIGQSERYLDIMNNKPIPKGRGVPAWLEPFWSNRRLGFAGAAAVAAAGGLLSAWWTPRGPVTSAEALASMAAALLLGLVAGLLSRSRWSLLLAPLLFIAVLEVARIELRGATVDAIHLGSLYGVIGFAVGRLFHGLLVLAPMLLGSLYGVWLAGRLRGDGSGSMGAVGWGVTNLLTLALVALAILLLRPAATPPILGPDGAPLPGSMAELIVVPIGGQQQAMMIRGRSVENPVLLYLAGGPGGTDIGAMRRDTSLEQHFVVVTWEQRGVGKSYGALDPIETLTLEQAISDTIEVTEYLRERFDEEKIYLVGNSWGATLGVLAAQRHPELYHAYVGTGQMVSQRQTDILFYEDTLAWAEETGNERLARELRRNGPPPYDTLLPYEAALSHEHEWNPYPEMNLDNEMPAILFVPENTLMDQVNGFRSFLDTFSILYPQLQGIDFRRDVTRLELPVYMLLGEHEARGRATLANEWFDMLDAPSKERIIFEGAGHRAHFDQPAAFTALMARIAAETYPRP